MHFTRGVVLIRYKLVFHAVLKLIPVHLIGTHASHNFVQIKSNVSPGLVTKYINHQVRFLKGAVSG
jgi:hypothetical protein